MTKQKTTSYRKYIKLVWIFFFSGLLAVILMFFAISMGWLGYMPDFEELENPKSNLSSEIYSADQVLLGKYFIEDRSNIHYRNLSPYLINALVATEDYRFEKHSGIDIKAILRAIAGVVTGRSAGGGSTITQQLAKNLFSMRDESKSFIVLQKFKEWVVSVQLEDRYTKEEIMAMYFNTVTFGGHSYGIKTASKTFFNSSPDSLKIEEAAMLVGMLQAPSKFNPVRNPERATKRREIVLSQMKKYDFITETEYDSLRILPLDLSKYKLQDHNTGLATYMREHLRGKLKVWCKNHKKPDGTPYNLYKDGLKIYTTINSRMQKYAEQAVSEHLGKDLQKAFFKHWAGNHKHPPFNYKMTDEQIENIMNQAMKRSDRYYWLNVNKVDPDTIKKIFNTPTQMTVFRWNQDQWEEFDTIMTPMDSILYYKYFLRVGLMSIEPHTGYVRAYVGGINYKHFKYDQVSQGKRQVGSTFKPFVYALAMSEGEYSPCTKVPNIKVSIELPTGKYWEPRNSGDYKDGQMVTLKEALANSINRVSAYLIKRHSPMGVLKLAANMGIDVSNIEPVPAICLGTPSLSVYEMVGAQSTFVNKGVYIEPTFITRIEDKNGNVIETFIPKQKEAMSEETAYLMLDLMKGVVQSGTGQRLRYRYGFTNPIAGKTGTTQNQSDGWFMGLTPDLVTGVWVGCEDRGVHFRSITLGQGANMALPIWALYMKRVYADKSLNISIGDFEKPEKELSVEINCTEYEKQNRAESKDFDF
ncbi:MAG: transglycosylase domain-containing protein [Saprospiraceae bacterium]|nr:transglycosylase domain-containing protein [Saprospiraceae bacterium]